jgi:tetratricopeptide (TPR) repeat protein
MANLAWTFDKMGRVPEAVPLLDQAVQGAESAMGPDHPITALWRQHALEVFERAERWAEAAALHARRADQLLRKRAPDHPDLADEWGNEGLCHLRAGNPAGAEVAFRKCLRVEEVRFPDEWRRFYGTALLGESLRAQKKYAEAEPLLLKGFQGMKDREKTMAPERRALLPETLEHLIELDTALNKPDEVKKWRTELLKYRPEAAPPPREVKNGA